MVFKIALGILLAKLTWEVFTMLIAGIVLLHKKVRIHQQLRKEAQKIKEANENRSTN